MIGIGGVNREVVFGTACQLPDGRWIEKMNRYEDRIKQLEQEVKEKQEEIELTNNQNH